MAGTTISRASLLRVFAARSPGVPEVAAHLLARASLLRVLRGRRALTEVA